MSNPYASFDEYGFRHLPRHLAHSGRVEKLREMLCDFDWLQAKLDVVNVDALLVDYDHLPEETELHMVQNALRLSAHILAQDKTQLAGQLMGRLLTFEQTEIQSMLARARKYEGAPWLRPLASCLTRPGGPLIRTLGRATAGGCIVVTPDWRRMVSVLGAGKLQVWDLQTGVCEHTLKGHFKRVNVIALTPDGRRAVSGSDDKTLKVWDLQTGEYERTLVGHTHRICAVAVTPDGQLAVSAELFDGTMKVWDLQTGECERTLEGHTDRITEIVVTLDGQRAVSASCDKTLKVWDLQTGECKRTLEGHTKRVWAVAVTPDGRRAVSGSEDSTLKVWDLQTGACEHTLKGQDPNIILMRALSVTPDGRQAVSWSKDNTLKVWDLRTGKCERTLEGQHTEYARGGVVALTPDGWRGVSKAGGTSGLADLKVWDLQTNAYERMPDGRGSIEAVVVTPDGRQAVSRYRPGPDSTRELHVWDLQTSKCERTLKGHTDWVTALAVTPDGHRVVSGSHDTTLKVWDLRTGACEHTLEGHIRRVETVAITPDGRQAVSGSEDSTLKVWDLQTGVCERTLMGHMQRVLTVAVTPDGQRVVSKAGGGLGSPTELKVWNLQTGKCESTLKESNRLISITPDGQRIISASARTLSVWDLHTGDCERTLRGLGGDTIGVVAVTPDGRRVVFTTGKLREQLQVWDLQMGRCKHILKEHTEQITSVAVTPDGQRAVSTSNDGTLKVWDLQTGKLIATFTAEESIRSCAITLDSLTAVAGSSGGHVYSLRLESVQPNASIVTAWHKYNEGAFAFGCPYCRKWSEIAPDDPGNELPCPRCGRDVKLNPFVIEGDWQKVAGAWDGNHLGTEGELYTEINRPNGGDGELLDKSSRGKRIFILSDDDKPDGARTSIAEFEAILSESYDVTVWSIARDGVPTTSDLAGYGAYIIDSGDYAFDVEKVEALSALENIDSVNVPQDNGGVMLIGAQQLPLGIKFEPINDLQVNDASHPLTAGFAPDEVITLLASESNVPAAAISDTNIDGETQVIFTRGPGSSNPGTPALIATPDIIAAFAFYRLPEDAQRTLALNTAKWLFGFNDGGS
ncbi:MAG: hypothetical protein GY832_46820 [Chloroflexi bacterium]|nr:hypothetical protein [Chloroflexota bacterium]